LRDEQARLRRLVRTQRELARLLEAKIVAGNGRLSQLEHTRAGILSALDRVGWAGLALYSSTMRRLTDIGTAARKTEVEIVELNRTLLKVRLRQEALSRRAEHVKVTVERKAMEAETLEVSIGMQRKATGKHDVLE
jgi:hypothetical protein